MSGKRNQRILPVIPLPLIKKPRASVAAADRKQPDVAAVADKCTANSNAIQMKPSLVDATDFTQDKSLRLLEKQNKILHLVTCYDGLKSGDKDTNKSNMPFQVCDDRTPLTYTSDPSATTPSSMIPVTAITPPNSGSAHTTNHDGHYKHDHAMEKVYQWVQPPPERVNRVPCVGQVLNSEEVQELISSSGCHTRPTSSGSYGSFPFSMGASPVENSVGDVAMRNAISMKSHMAEYFNNPTYADCELIVTDEKGGRHVMMCHTMVIARSPTLCKILQQHSMHSYKPMATVPVHLVGQYVSVSAFIDCIRFLYGGLLAEDVPKTWQMSMKDCMCQIISHIATGEWLGVREITDSAVKAARDTLDWSSMEALLDFCLNGGLSSTFAIKDDSETDSDSTSHRSSSRDRGFGRPEWDPYATMLLEYIIEYSIYNLPSCYYLDAAVSSSLEFPGEPMLHDKSLDHMQFGHLPLEGYQRPTGIVSTISSILLSLPFAILKIILEHDILTGRIGATTVASIMRQIVNERERRRCLRATEMANEAKMRSAAPGLKARTLWSEGVEPSSDHAPGFRITRRRLHFEALSAGGH
ncbi:hypothetical protein K470DRAFT_254687 [Piedraia hortae CBS 480.64]|uniref:BTB domain-containing protein n=1 Tax=Piedraia hortae CBS 480.64 TaxID=1314780 RepID=A0A6A7C8G6_9PEZI|nr:hypothetical protein K470DRAFT_254687 [Piedraia hortae CBS 480.64]